MNDYILPFNNHKNIYIKNIFIQMTYASVLNASGVLLWTKSCMSTINQLL